MGTRAGVFGAITFPDARFLKWWLADKSIPTDGLCFSVLGKAGHGAVVSTLFPGQVGEDVYALTSKGLKVTIQIAIHGGGLGAKGLEALAALTAAIRHQGVGELVVFVDADVTGELTLRPYGKCTLAVPGKPRQVHSETGFAAYEAALAKPADVKRPSKSTAKPKAPKLPANKERSGATLVALERAKKWTPKLLDAAFTELRAEAVIKLAELVAKRDLTQTGVAYDTLFCLLPRMIDKKLDAAPLRLLLEPIVRFPKYNPDKMRQLEYVRTLSMRLFARAKHPAVRPQLVHILEDFPESLASESASTYLYALAEIAIDLGDKSLAPLFAPLLDKMLLKHSVRRREDALEPTRKLVATLGRRR